MENNAIVLIFILAIMGSIRISTWNIRGVMYGTPRLISLLNSSDIVVITEHWLKAANSTFLETVHCSFNAFTKTNDGSSARGSGGVSILCRKSTEYSVKLVPSTGDHTVFFFFLKGAISELTYF